MGTLYTASFGSSFGQFEVASTELGLAYVSLPRASGRGLHGWQQRHFADYQMNSGYEPNRIAIVQLTEYLEGKRFAFIRGVPKMLAPQFKYQRQGASDVRPLPGLHHGNVGSHRRRLGEPGAGLSGLVDAGRRPECATAVGLALYGRHRRAERPVGSAMRAIGAL